MFSCNMAAPWIIEGMPVKRAHLVAVRLSDEELRLRDLLAEHLGVNEAGVLRQGLLRLARAEGIELPPEKPHRKLK